jgi:hypothetical protein
MAAIALTLSGGARAAEPTVAGLWQIIEDGKAEGWALFVDHDGVFEGVLAKTIPEPVKGQLDTCTKCKDDRKDAPVLGLPFIRDMKRDGLKYEGGNILDLRDGGVWKAKMTLSPDGQVLTLRGYLGFSLLGQNRTWQRLPDSNLALLDPSVIAKYLPTMAAGMKPGVPGPAPAKSAVTVAKKAATPTAAPGPAAAK